MHYDHQAGEHRLIFDNGFCLSWYAPRRYSATCAWWWRGTMLRVGELGRC